jgi:hypothetical protein
MCGFRLLFYYLQQKNDARLEAQFDNNSYDDSQLVELKIPVHLPYQNSWPTYQRFDGEIELNGTMYKYVKRRLANDTLYLMCIPNSKKMRLEVAKNDFYNISNDLAQDDHSQKSDHSRSLFRNIRPFYDGSSFLITISNPFTTSHPTWPLLSSEKFHSSTIATPWQPPDFLFG